MWIKICGNTNLEDARLAVEGGADALGFVFAPSPRRVTQSQVRRIMDGLPAEVESYGVFVDADFAGIVSTVHACGLAGVQLHRSVNSDLPRRLREHFAGLGRGLKVVRVLDWRAGRDFDQALFDQSLDESAGDPAIDAVLVDSSTAKAAGGTGIRFSWNLARSSFLRMSPRLRMIVAGGLNPENVGEAISLLQPWGVDVVSGIEAAPGKKDGARLAAFILAARQASAEVRKEKAQ